MRRRLIAERKSRGAGLCSAAWRKDVGVERRNFRPFVRQDLFENICHATGACAKDWLYSTRASIRASA